MRSAVISTLAVLFFAVTLASAAPPRVLFTTPDNGDNDVPPDAAEIRITFDQPMDPDRRSIVGGGDSFPVITGDVKWIDSKTIVVPVQLKPDHDYWFSINSDTFKGFANPEGEPALWYPVSFHTRPAGAAPAAVNVTAAQNKQALLSLRQAIDQDYAYRDRLHIDWAREIADRQQTFEHARTQNEFARLTAHLLRLADDAHVSVRLGDRVIGTHSNSSPPNFNYQVLSGLVAGWHEDPAGIATGKFADGIGYLAVSECNAQQAAAVDTAMDQFKDSPGLILDLRCNGGGDETAALKIAGRFVPKTAVYSRDRLRTGGNWQGPFDRAIEPREGVAHFARPVAVLIGPKVLSSAESFALMMKHGAGAELVGDFTGGSSGNPRPHDLGNGVIVNLPSWEDCQPDGAVIEGVGVKPDLSVRPLPREFNDADPVVDAALQWLRDKRK